MRARWPDSWARPRWFEFVPEVATAAVLTGFAATEPHAAASAFRSAKALTLMAAVAVAWLALRALTFASLRRPLLRTIPFFIGAFAIVRVVVFPAYDDHAVIETLAVTPASSVPATPAVPGTDPVIIRRGELSGIDHRATGTVNVYARSNGRFVVGLEEFDIQPGPAYAVYVVPGADRRDHDHGARLASLRGNRGTQFYETPPAVDLRTGEWTVLVWCETFDVPVAHSTPSLS